MASGLGNNFGNTYVNRMLRATAFIDSTTLFLALFTAAPSYSDGGTTNWNAASAGARD